MTCYTNAKIKNGTLRNTSYGVIVYKEDDDITYCLVRRWHTFAYSDFIQGKYQLEDRDRIYQMFELMTLREKEGIQAAASFTPLWQQYWDKGGGDQTRYSSISSKKEYKMAMHKYDMLVKGYDVSMPLTLGVKASITLHLPVILATTSFLDSPEWGFPKGKLNNIHETPLMCAQRELKEETNLDMACLDVPPPPQFVETFVGNNGVPYNHIYYMAKCRDAKTPLVCDPQNVNQVIEIGDIGWFSYDECLKLFREKDYAKKNVLTQVHQIVVSNNRYR